MAAGPAPRAEGIGDRHRTAPRRPAAARRDERGGTGAGKGVGVGLRKGDTELMDKFNAAIAKIREDGTYDKITANYFASSIYGG